MSELRDIRLLSQVSDGFANAGYTADDVNWLRSNQPLLKDILAIRTGRGRIVIDSWTINMDAPSMRIPSDWKVREQDQLLNRARGVVELDSITNASLYLSAEQTTGKMYAAGPDLKKELGKLKDQLVVTDAVVDFYLDHKEIPTPQAWLGKWIVCWGRVYYRYAGVYLIVRCLYCYADGSRNEHCYYVSNHFSSYDPALVISAGKSVLGA